jgi:hypothetical protein
MEKMTNKMRIKKIDILRILIKSISENYPKEMLPLPSAGEDRGEGGQDLDIYSPSFS